MKRTPSCRYIPSCSQYALEALQKYGPLKGSYLAVRRILRCNHFHNCHTDRWYTKTICMDFRKDTGSNI